MLTPLCVSFLSVAEKLTFPKPRKWSAGYLRYGAFSSLRPEGQRWSMGMTGSLGCK